MKKYLFLSLLTLTFVGVTFTSFGQDFYEKNGCQSDPFIGDDIYRMIVPTGVTLPFYLDLTRMKVYKAVVVGNTLPWLWRDANDEFRSMTFYGCKDINGYPVDMAGYTIEIYDDGSASKSDDWTRITIHKNPPTKAEGCIHSFEQSYSNEYFTVTHYHHNGLDGKVSYIKYIKP